jgi:hypothetical protein
VELPQEFRLPQNEIVKIFERRVGRIAVMNQDGNILVMDQTGENVVQITRDANLRPRNGELLPTICRSGRRMRNRLQWSSWPAGQ